MSDQDIGHSSDANTHNNATPQDETSHVTPDQAASRLASWVELIRNQDMLIFDRTVAQVISLAQDERAPISELAQVVLQDASLTARVLKLANSTYYNPTGVSISTVARAIILLGFNVIRNICLALALVETMLKGATRQRLARELAHRIHTAMQARGLATIRGDQSPEEVFITALLQRIGELAFWCFSGDLGEQLERLTTHSGLQPEQAQEQLLGFQLSQLNRKLIREWNLTSLLQDQHLQTNTSKENRAMIIQLAQQIDRCAVSEGWYSPALESILQRVSRLIKLPIDEARNLLHQQARAACTMASDLGAYFVISYIPSPSRSNLDREAFLKPNLPALQPLSSNPVLSGPALPTASLKIKVLRELAMLLDEPGGDCNLILELVLEGIHRGIGVDRVLFALAAPDKQAVKAKYVLGEDHADLLKGFRFLRPDNTPHILFQTLDRKLPRWVTAREIGDDPAILPPDLIKVVGRVPLLLAPIMINNQCFGLFYADRGPSKRPLDQNIFEDFKHFVYQASMGLTKNSIRPVL